MTIRLGQWALVVTIGFLHGAQSTVLHAKSAFDLARQLDTPAVRALFKLDEFRALSRALQVGDPTDLARALQGSDAASRSSRNEILHRINKIEESVAELRIRAHLDHGAPYSIQDRQTRPLNPHEELLVRILGRRYFKLKDPNKPLLISTHNTSGSFHAAPGARFQKVHDVFFHPQLDTPLIGKIPRTTLSAAEEGRFLLWLKNQYKEYDRCLSNQSKPDSRADYWYSQLSGLALGQTLTASGYLINAGERDVRLDTLSADLLVTALSNAISIHYLSEKSTFRVRWTKYTAIGTARATLDLVVYRFDLVQKAGSLASGKSAPEEPTWQQAGRRYTYNMTWNLLNSPRSPLLWVIFQGFLCRYPHSTVYLMGKDIHWAKPLNIGSRLGTDLGMTVLYFNAREWMLGDENPGGTQHFQ